MIKEQRNKSFRRFSIISIMLVVCLLFTAFAPFAGLTAEAGTSLTATGDTTSTTWSPGSGSTSRNFTIYDYYNSSISGYGPSGQWSDSGFSGYPAWISGTKIMVIVANNVDITRLADFAI